MARIEISVVVAAVPRLVGAFFVPQRMPYWYGVEMRSCFEVQDGAADFCAGQKVRIHGTVGRREISLTAVILRYELGRILEWRFQDAYGIRGVQRWEIEAAEDSTRVHMLDQYEMPGRAGRIVDWLVTRHAVARRDRDALARLKRLAERK
jgi:Polyketide cyclase / dehydrase and lipid transport